MKQIYGILSMCELVTALTAKILPEGRRFKSYPRYKSNRATILDLLPFINDFSICRIVLFNVV